MQRFSCAVCARMALRCANRVAAGRVAMPAEYAQLGTLTEVPTPQVLPLVAVERLVITSATAATDSARALQQCALRALHAGLLAELYVAKVCRDPLAACREDLIDCLQRCGREHVAGGAPCASCDALRAAGGMCGLAGCLACAATVGDDPERPGRLKLCSRCKRAAYCCKEHQLRAWREHKKQCIAAEQQGDAAGASATR